MASCDVDVTVGIEIIDPNWKVMCLALTSHSMRALGYLEAGRSDLALAALNDARSVGDLAMMVRSDLPKDDEKTKGI
jgi:hypothetical protein